MTWTKLTRLSGADSTRKYLAMGTVAKELDRLGRGIVNEKVTRNQDRGGWGGPMAAFG
jgi:hypothetical protein